MKFVSNFVSLSIIASSLTAFNVPGAFAGTKPMKPLKVEMKQNSQDVIKQVFAKFSMEMHTSKVQNKQVIYRQALTSAALKFSENGIKTKDLIGYAVSDMNPMEAKAFQNDIKSLAGADLNSPEGEELLQRIMASQGRGSNFLPCGVGQFLPIYAGLAAFVVGIVALSNLQDETRDHREGIDKERTAINSEITILKAEGVQSNSYLITSRNAELAQLNLEYAQLIDAKERNEKSVQTLGIIAGGLAVVALIGYFGEDCSN